MILLFLQLLTLWGWDSATLTDSLYLKTFSFCGGDINPARTEKKTTYRSKFDLEAGVEGWLILSTRYGLAISFDEELYGERLVLERGYVFHKKDKWQAGWLYSKLKYGMGSEIVNFAVSDAYYNTPLLDEIRINGGFVEWHNRNVTIYSKTGGNNWNTLCSETAIQIGSFPNYARAYYIFNGRDNSYNQVLNAAGLESRLEYRALRVYYAGMFRQAEISVRWSRRQEYRGYVELLADLPGNVLTGGGFRLVKDWEVSRENWFVQPVIVWKYRALRSVLMGKYNVIADYKETRIRFLQLWNLEPFLEIGIMGERIIPESGTKYWQFGLQLEIDYAVD
ncbi:MAG: hypothetical protein K8S56_06775 [Candidatus Cloacimonetes bacterium]|nr:hypothetical protein [Candidatus Cloacimonadota bacterium]